MEGVDIRMVIVSSVGRLPDSTRHVPDKAITTKIIVNSRFIPLKISITLSMCIRRYVYRSDLLPGHEFLFVLFIYPQPSRSRSSLCEVELTVF